MDKDLNILANKKQSMIRRLTIISVTALALAVLVVGGGALILQHRLLNQALESKAIGLTSFAAEISIEPILLRDFSTLLTSIQGMVDLDEDVIYAVIFDNSDQPQPLIYYFDQKNTLVFETIDNPLSSDVTKSRDELKETGLILEVSTPIVVSGEQLGKATVGLSYEQTRGAIQNQVIIFAIVILISIGLTIFVIVNVLRRTLLPLETLTIAAAQISAGNLDVRVEASDRLDEIGVLTQAFADMTQQLTQLIGRLEGDVQQMRALAVISEDFSATLKLEDLLDNVVNKVQETFGYYQAHIYLIDDEQKNLVVVAGTGQAGAEMKAQGHQIPLDAQQSLVVRAVRTQQVVYIENIQEAEDCLPNPLLPDTHTEMAVPIILEGQVVGILDVHEKQVGALDKRDADRLRLLANQVAVAIHNARLFERTEQALTEAREAYQLYVQQAWQKAQHGARLQHHYGQMEASALTNEMRKNVKQLALSEKQTVTVPLEKRGEGQNDDNPQTVLVSPTIVGGHTIGTLQLYRTPTDVENQGWTKEEMTLVEAILDQFAQTAENLRLFEETRQRANFDQLVNDIQQKLRQSPTLDTLIKTAAEELGNVLGASHGLITLGSNSDVQTEQPKELSNGSNGIS